MFQAQDGSQCTIIRGSRSDPGCLSSTGEELTTESAIIEDPQICDQAGVAGAGGSDR